MTENSRNEKNLESPGFIIKGLPVLTLHGFLMIFFLVMPDVLQAFTCGTSMSSHGKQVQVQNHRLIIYKPAQESIRLLIFWELVSF